MDVSHGTELHQLREEVARLRVANEELRTRLGEYNGGYPTNQQIADAGARNERDHLHHALSKCVVALESALAGVWDGFYSGKGIVAEYAQAVDKEVKDAIATAKELLK